jgi:hypothetical protein
MAQGQRRVIEGQFGQVGVARRQGLTTGVEKKAEKAKKSLTKSSPHGRAMYCKTIT